MSRPRQTRASRKEDELHKAIWIFLASALALTGAAAQPAHAVPSYIAAALADPDRPADQVARDGLRKPGEVISFAGMKPGDRIGEIMPASGYFTRIFSRVAGPRGRVYAFVPIEEVRNCLWSETDGGLALAHDPHYPNVHVSVAPVDEYRAAEPLDVVFTAQNYHDLHDPFMGPADLKVFDANVFRALKHGGVFLVIDHAAEAGSGVRDTNTLHRIDPAVIVKEVEAAGFKLAAEGNMLRNPADAHTLFVFDPRVRGRTDQVVLKFAKP